MKTKEELNALKNEVEALNKKLAELTEEELAQVSGGGLERVYGNCGHMLILTPSKTKCYLNFTFSDENPCRDCPYK